MSAGAFLDAFYTSDAGETLRITIQPETAALVIETVTNTVPAGPATQLASAIAGGTRRQIGVKARSVTLRFTGMVPDGYSGDDVRVVVLTPTAFNAYVLGGEGTYLTAPVRVVGKTPEFIR